MKGRIEKCDVCRSTVNVYKKCQGRTPTAEIARALSIDCGVLCRMLVRIGLKISARSGRRTATENELMGRAAIVAPITVPGGDSRLVEECVQIGMAHAIATQRRMRAVAGSLPPCEEARRLRMRPANCGGCGECVRNVLPGLSTPGDEAVRGALQTGLRAPRSRRHRPGRECWRAWVAEE